MRANRLIFEATAFDNIIGHLKNSPSITDPRRQFRNDPTGDHKKARAIFHTWAKQRLKGYRAGILRSNVGSSRIAFLSFVGLMQRECGIKVTGIFDIETVRAFEANQDKFTDAYFTAKVKSFYDPKIPKEYYDVVRAIENQSTGGQHWSSTYATYWNYSGKQDFGIGPGQVEPGTYVKDVKGNVQGANFDFANFNHTTDIKMLTKAMSDTIKRKQQIVGDGGTLEQFAKAWNPVNFAKAKAVYSGNKKSTIAVKPKLRPDNIGQNEPDDIEQFKKADTSNQVAKAPAPGVISQIGKFLQGYFQ